MVREIKQGSESSATTAKIGTASLGPGKRSLVTTELDAPNGGAPVQALAGPGPKPLQPDQVQAVANRGIAGPAGALPHLDTIQRLFGRHDVSGVKAHVGGEAAEATKTMGAEAYASGNNVAFAGAPGLHTAAHEAAHVVQQRAGVQLKGGVGAVGDPYEQHADQVADAVVRGESAERLLDAHAGGTGPRAEAVQRQAVPVDAGVAPPAAGVPVDPLDADPTKTPDADLGQAYVRAVSNGDTVRAQALDDEMDRRAGTGTGTAIPRGPQPITSGNGAVTSDVALSLLDNMADGKPPFKPSEGIGGCSWFTTEGNPYTSVSADKDVTVQVEIAKGSSPLIFQEADLIKIFDDLIAPTRELAETEYRARFNIPQETPLSNRALKRINRTFDRFVEKQMWKRVGETVASSSQKVGEVIFPAGGRFSETAGKFAVVADASKISLKGGTAPLVDALAKGGITAEPVVVQAAEKLASKMRWAGRVRGVFRYGGKILVVVAIAADLVRIYRAHDHLKATVTSVGGWTGATAAGAAFAAWWTPADAAGPWAWAAHGVGTLGSGAIGYWFGSEVTRHIYELVAE
jgi:hypothetical protein